MTDLVDERDMEVDWDMIEEAPKATSQQRRTLYRLGCAKTLVRKLDQQQADALIKSMIAFRSKNPLPTQEKSAQD